MSNPDQVDKDLREYLSKADNLRGEDKMKYLRALFDKHFTFTKLDHVIIRHDLASVIGDAKSNMATMRSRPHISGKLVEQCNLTHVAVIEAFIGYLNRNGLLKKHVAFDYTDEPNFDSIED